MSTDALFLLSALTALAFSARGWSPVFGFCVGMFAWAAVGALLVKERGESGGSPGGTGG